MKYLTIKEVAEVLKVTEKTVKNWIKNNKIHYKKVGGTVRIPESEVMK